MKNIIARISGPLLLITLFLLLTSKTFAVAGGAPPNGLNTYWAFDDQGSTAVDSSGDGSNGVLVGGPVWGQGKDNGAIVFNGTNQYVSVPDSGVLDFGNGSFSFGGWFKTTSTLQGNLISKEATQTTRGWRLIMLSGQIQARMDDNSVLVSTPYSAAKNDGTWHHAMVTVDRLARLMHLYIDGIEVTPATTIPAAFGSVTDVNTPLTLGVFYHNNAPLLNFFAGSLDEFRLYNRVLSPTEVVNTMNDSGLSNGAVAVPAISPVGGTFSTPQSVTISDATPGSTIYYTTDGSTPTPSSPQYTGPFTVSSNQTVQAIATAPNYTSSTLAVAPFTITYVTSLLDQSYSSLSPVRKFDLSYSNSQQNPQNNPIVVFLHGGGWIQGDKSLMATISADDTVYLAQHGFNVYSINYTLAQTGVPSTEWPAQIQDVKCFLNYLGSGQAFGDPNRISIWGYSAGGHLALMATLTNKNQFAPANCEWGNSNYTIVSMEGSAPPVDLNTLFPISVPAQTPIQTLLGYVPSTNPDGAAAASPISYVSANVPPIFIEGGSADATVPQSQLQQLQNAFSNIGVNITHLTFAGATHDLDFASTTGQSFPPLFAFLQTNGTHTIALPSISSFFVTPATMISGTNATLSWATNGASTVSVDNGVGTVTGQSSVTVAPATTTTYTLTATNVAGSATAQAVLTVTNPDTTPPTAVLSAQDNQAQDITGGETISGPITLNVVGTDPFVEGQPTYGVSQIKLFLDGNLIASSAVSPLTYNLNTDMLVDNSHSIFATVTDGAGNSTNSRTFLLNTIGFSAQLQ